MNRNLFSTDIQDGAGGVWVLHLRGEYLEERTQLGFNIALGRFDFFFS